VHFGLANFPVAYCGLKIITSLSLRFPDFQRRLAALQQVAQALAINKGLTASATRLVAKSRLTPLLFLVILPRLYAKPT